MVRKNRGESHQHTVVYPQHHFDPKDLLTFVEMEGFTKEWHDLGLDDEDDLSALQIMIMMEPHSGPVVRGTGGLRKLRFSPDDWSVGKRGGLRVCYVYFEQFGLVLLVTVYSKTEKDDLSAEGKKAIRQLIDQTETFLQNDYFA